MKYGDEQNDSAHTSWDGSETINLRFCIATIFIDNLYFKINIFKVFVSLQSLECKYNKLQFCVRFNSIEDEI